MHNCIVYLVYFLVALCCIVYIRHNDLNFFHYNYIVILYTHLESLVHNQEPCAKALAITIQSQ